MITREQVGDLQPGDVVEIRHEDYPGVVISGPLSIHAARGELMLGPITTVRLASGRSGWEGPAATLTVVSRAPRPLYVNHPRTEPVAGDVMIPVHHDANDVATWSWCPLRSGVHRWRETHSDAWLAPEDIGDDLRLLVDGETGQVVP